MFLRSSGMKWGLSALCCALIAIVPAVGAPSENRLTKRNLYGIRSGIGTFTPAAADPRLAAILGRSGIANSGFRFTPTTTIGKNRSVTVAVRAQTNRRAVVSERIALVEPVTSTAGVAPASYDLGVGVGWKRFALHGDISRIDNGILPGSRESADIGISFNSKKWSTRVQLAAERPIGNAPRSLTGGESMAVDVGGMFQLSRNVDLMAGVRYKREVDLGEDARRDSQAVYVGTAFRF
jgi:hypothetical protein